MKFLHYLFAIFFVLIFFTSSFAQKGLSIQLESMIGFSKLAGVKYQPNSFLNNPSPFGKQTKKKTNGYQMGITAEYNFTNYLGLNVGVLYTIQGQNYDTYADINGAYYGNDLSISYIKIPLKFIFSTNTTKTISFRFSSGFYIGLLYDYTDKRKLDFTYSDGRIENRSNTKLTRQEYSYYNLYRNDFGIALSSGMQTKITRNLFLLLTVDYDLGLIDIRNMFSPVFGGLARYQDFLPDTHSKKKNILYGISIGIKRKFSNF